MSGLMTPPAVPSGLIEDEDIEHALKWCYAACGDKTSDVRERVARAQQRYLSHVRDSAIRGDDVTLEMLGTDAAASVLAQADALLTNRLAYDLSLGTYFVPFMKQLGSNIAALKAVEGADDRAARMLLKKGSDPVGALFELVAAVRYVLDGYDVAFVQEKPGIAKTPDLRVARSGAFQHVECKRLRSGSYETGEKTQQRRLFAPLAEYVCDNQLSLHLDVRYSQELKNIPDGYLLGWARKAVNCRLTLPSGYPWSDEFGSGTVRPADLEAVSADIQQNGDLFFGPKLARLLIGQPVSEPYSMTGIFDRSRHDPRFVRSIRAGTVVTWRCEAEESMDNKSRHVRARLAEIDSQLSEVGEGIGHIGIDANGDADVSDIRREKNFAAVKTFGCAAKINAVYLHYFVCRVTETNSWMIDETVDYFGLTSNLPLSNARLFNQSEIVPNDLPAWRQAAPSPRR